MLDYPSLAVALALLLALREGRVQGDRQRYDAARGEQRRSALSTKVPELKTAREEYLRQEAERRDREAEARMQEARRRAEQEEEERRRREEQYRIERQREEERLRQQKEAERLAFDQQELAMKVRERSRVAPAAARDDHPPGPSRRRSRGGRRSR